MARILTSVEVPGSKKMPQVMADLFHSFGDSSYSGGMSMYVLDIIPTETGFNLPNYSHISNTGLGFPGINVANDIVGGCNVCFKEICLGQTEWSKQYSSGPIYAEEIWQLVIEPLPSHEGWQEEESYVNRIGYKDGKFAYIKRCIEYGTHQLNLRGVRNPGPHFKEILKTQDFKKHKEFYENYEVKF